MRLTLASQEVSANETLLSTVSKFSPLQLVKVFIDDALDAVKSGELDKASQRLVLAEQQLSVRSLPIIQNNMRNNSAAVNSTTPVVHSRNKYII
jgi:hypothetical protein